MRTYTNSFPHGVHPPDCKYTADQAIEDLPLPSEVSILLSQHIGAPAKAIVKRRDEVMRGEPVAEAVGFVSVPMHSPIAGTVTKVDYVLNPQGLMSQAVQIKLDPDADQEEIYGTPRDVASLSQDELISAVQATGTVGLGGAAFPTHVKMKPPADKPVNTIIVNGCECEPYLTTDFRVMVEDAEKIITGIQLVMDAMKAKEAIIAIENNKPEALDIMEKAIPEGAPISVRSLVTKYPQGAEKMLTRAVLHRDVPSGGLPSDIGVGCFNVATLLQLGQLLPQGRGLIERVITVSGGGVERPGNYRIPLGTSIRYIMEQVGIRPEARKIISGGPMMGMSLSSQDIPLTKGMSGLLVLTEEEMRDGCGTVYPCIKCARCVDACPIFLNPSLLGLLARKGRYEEMAEEHHLNDCFECGCCTYVCPSNIPLVQYFRIAKAMNREKEAAK
ncbi:MAG: electron transport complex subunit RsxC [Candidatus Hydrogenedens sp.]|jgi:electron transport complex protein RnfC|nr:electron transport complex subunit RsxC [Candidatus Hydrogenedens sp.]